MVEESEELENDEIEATIEVTKEPEKEEVKISRKKTKKKKVVKKRKSKKEKEDLLAHAIRLAVETGNVEFGAKTGIKDSLLGKAKLIVVAANTPKELYEDLSYYSKLSLIPIITFEGTSLELGSICGKPYSVSVLSVYNAGNSNIMELIKK